MRNYILVLCLILLSFSASFAQEQKGVATVVGSTSSQKDNLGSTVTTTVNGVSKTINIKSVSIQVGMPYMGVKDAPFTNNPTQYYRHDLGFPWGIRYRYNTFSEDAFTVSKGYFSDRIELNWDIKMNREKIVSISIYRTEDIDSQNPNWGRALKTLPADAGTFSDNNIEGGKLYRYKVAAKGVEVDGLEIPYATYITGIGYRNPTGVVTGNISFTGGNPVRDVLVTANPTGSQLRFGSSLNVPAGGYVSVSRLHKGLKDSITLQAWFKPQNNLSTWRYGASLYKLQSDANETLTFGAWTAEQNWRGGGAASERFIQLTLGNAYIALFAYYPSGEIDNSGEDILVPVDNINNSFIHCSAVVRDNKTVEFYINGRLMDAAYRTKMTNILAKKGLPAIRLDIASNIVKLNTTASGQPQSWSHFTMGGGEPTYIDEFRVWETALTPAQIKRDYRRYLNGNEAYLHTYISANETIGDYAYDLAHTGFNYHGNNAKLSNTAFNAANTPRFDNTGNNIPTNTQLGVLGVTDEFGNYVISAIPYKGNGDSFTIVPSLGKHEFNPKQQLAFLGVGSTVVNKIDFTDKSSFVFKGHAVYDSRNVFPSTGEEITGNIRDDEAYNAYIKDNLKYQKGEYWAEKDATGKILRLKRYAQIPVPGAFVSIDGVQAIDANNAPVQTDIDGRFTIQVPIGQHAITLTKDGHTFAYDGRYPAKTSTTVNGVTTVTNTYQDFYEDRDEAVTFIDNTKVIVIGRVVGGTAQADKTIGFGYDGKKTYNYRDANGVSRSTDYTSLNNIGSAQITLGYLPTGATSVTPEYRAVLPTTNVQTGEYRYSLLPLSYMLSQNDIRFISGRNPDGQPILDADRVVNFTTIKPLQYPKFIQGKDTITGQPYQEILKFAHIATPVQKILSQSSDAAIQLNGVTYTITSAQTIPIYTQFGEYKIEVQGQEIYNNYDASLTAPVVNMVPVEGGTLVVTNNLALEGSEKLAVSANDPSILVYTFKGGMPNTNEATGFKRTIDIKYRSNGTDYPVTGYKTEGILMGGEADGSQTFVTAGPQIPDFILRDPPGSGSSARIEKGSTFSFSKESSSSKSNGTDVNTTVSLGFKLTVGGGMLGPVMETETTNDISTGITMSQSSSNGKSLTNTYSFNQTIATSDDPNFVGGDADLYIGTSANQYYGTYNNLAASTTTNSVPIRVSYVSGTQTLTTNLYPRVNKAMYFNEAPEKTLFVYSQHQILNEIIPSYEEFVRQIEDGTLIENQNGVLTKSAYLSSINLWRKIILNNELSKYQALRDRDKLKVSLNAIIESLKDPKTGALSESGKKMKDLLNATFFENISFDAGIGEITKGFQTGRLTGTTQSYEMQLDQSVVTSVGATFNETGFGVETSTTNGSGSGSSSGDDNEETTNVSYTLKDNDANNMFSVDVINAFDGNGPIFITKGGQTSCPYEGPQLSYFYNPTHANATNASATIVPLTDAQRIELSVATIALEKPEITVGTADVAGIFDGRNAEFVLQLRNTSTANKDVSFLLTVDQSTNPDNAAINIEPNGTMINIPAGKTVQYTMTLKKVKQDQFEYRNIKVLLQSMCDGDVVDSVLVSASFVPACSPVTVMTPTNNWLMNRNTAYSGTATQPLNIKLGDFNTSFASFQKISLEYRLKGTPDWVNLRTYYKNQSDYDAAHTGGDTNIEMIVGTELNYAWDIAAIGLANGQYELRARTNCNNQTAFESQVIQGQVDLTAPVQFGEATPTNGILGIGDDLKVRFNEPVKVNGTVTRFEFLVQKNESPVAHQVSLAFNGPSNTATIAKPAITTGNFSIEFWLKNTSPAGTSTLLSQNGGLRVELINSDLKYTIGGESITAAITKDGKFNHYTLSYDATGGKLTIIENDKEKQTRTLNTKLSFTNENPIVLGGNTFIGNIHDLRFWKNNITRETSSSNMYSVFNGNESNLLGYWPMNEGNGALANDLARYKHLTIANTNWDINPKGTAYAFDGTNHLTLDQAAKVIIAKEMDATMSFWMKTDQTGVATLFSNGYGDVTDKVEENGYRNKWAISLNVDGKLDLKAENKTYSFGNVKVNTNTWHHIALSLTRNGTIRMFIDGVQMESYPSTNLGGFYSSNIFVGARGSLGSAVVDQYFRGTIDELCFWETARTADQIKADQFHEVDFKATGLILYANFNKPESANTNGPAYYHPLNATEKESHYALLNGKPLAFTDQTPAIKPLRPSESILVNAVINNDEIILKPEITDWATVEGKVANITVANLNDMADNRQLSPITWTALINRNPIKWFVEGHTDVVSLMKRANENLTFDITIINRGGTTQSYNIELPSWLTLSASSGSIAPNTRTTLKATVDSDLAIGTYNTILTLATGYGYNEKIQLDLRVLEKEPTLTLDPSKFTQSMNIIGKVKVNDVFTDDIYDKVVAMVNGEVRGMGNVTYDATFKEYFVYLTVYSNAVSGEKVSFFIWDASDGKLKEALLNSNFSIPYVPDQILGNYSAPAIFTNTEVTGQQITFNQGWTWTSFNVNDARFNNLNALTSTLILATSDRIQANANYDAYQLNPNNSALSGWSGSISAGGGISTTKMYKVNLQTGQKLNIKGVPVDLNTWAINLVIGWNWLPFVVSKNIPIADALANLKANDGDVVKSQSLFAIYSMVGGWKGSLTYLRAGEGYMLSTSIAQNFTYPEYLNRLNSRTVLSTDAKQNVVAATVLTDDVAPISKDYSKFAGTMSAVVKLPEGYQELSFYNAAGELRGNAKTQNVDGVDLAFITLYGDKKETLTAYLGSGSKLQATSTSFSFSSDAVLGSIPNPILIELAKEKVSVFPNPFQRYLDVVIESKARVDAKISIYSVAGQKMFDRSYQINQGVNTLKLDLHQIPTGAHILNIRIGDKVINQKIIKN